MPEAGSLIAIGGHEDRSGGRRILREVAARLDGRPLALITAASKHPQGYIDEYRTAFGDLGVTVLHVPADPVEGGKVIAESGGVFLTGGKQARLVETLTETGLADDVRRAWTAGAVVAGTSAGASAIAGRMMLSGPGKASPGGPLLELSDGLGFVDGVIIDQHFAERGRGGRLRAAVALEPGNLGLGIDEDTAVEFAGGTLTVHGSGAVTVIDASGAEVHPGTARRPATLRGATLHILAAGDTLPLHTA